MHILFNLIFTVILKIFGEFGYDCHHGSCRIIPNMDNYQGIPPDTIIIIIGWYLPCIIIIGSYGWMWFYIWKNNKTLKNQGTL